jgi:hypothetical protein
LDPWILGDDFAGENPIKIYGEMVHVEISLGRNTERLFALAPFHFHVHVCQDGIWLRFSSHCGYHQDGSSHV